MSTVARPPGLIPDAHVRRGREPVPPASSSSSQFTRRRLALAAGLLAAALAIAAALVLALGGSGEVPPATGAAAIVPANALAYVNLSIDPSRSAVSDARKLAARFPDWPLLETAALNRLRSLVAGSSSAPADIASAIRPWLGKEASVALIPGNGGSVQPLVVLDVTRAAQARAFVTHAGAAGAGVYDGTRILAYPSGSELAFVGHYLVAGSDAGVRAALDAAHRRAAALAHDPAYARAVATEPAGRVLDAYLPASGVRQLLASRTGIAGAIGMLLDRPALQGAAISLSPTTTGAQVLVHSVLGGAATRPAARSFTPTLQSVLPTGSTMMLDVDGLDKAAPGLLSAAATAGIAGNVGPLLRRVGSALVAQGVNVRRILSLFDGETAVAIAPGSSPALLIVSRVHDQAAAMSELAAVEGPVTTLFSPSGSAGGQVPELADQVVGGATVHEVGLGPGLQLNYAVFDGMVVVATSVQAIDGVAKRARALENDATYKATLADRPDRLTSLVFGDFSRLLALGEQTGLTGGARASELLPDLSKVRAIGLSSTSGERDTTTELNLEIR